LACTGGATFGAVSNPLRAPPDEAAVEFAPRVASVFVVLVFLSWSNVGLLLCADPSVATITEKIAASAARHKFWRDMAGPLPRVRTTAIPRMTGCSRT
jgi:hypothetical protein